MNIEFVPCIKNRALFLCLAEEYIKDLSLYDSAIVWDESTWNNAVWDADFISDGGILCGFVITNEVKYKKKDNLLYIAEFYVAKDERKRGVGTAAVEEIAERWDGDLFLYVLEKNETGKRFWDHVEDKLRWRRIERDDIQKEPGCELRVYRK